MWEPEKFHCDGHEDHQRGSDEGWWDRECDHHSWIARVNYRKVRSAYFKEEEEEEEKKNEELAEVLEEEKKKLKLFEKENAAWLKLKENLEAISINPKQKTHHQKRKRSLRESSEAQLLSSKTRDQ